MNTKLIFQNIEQELSIKIHHSQGVPGGDINRAYKIQSDDKLFFLKVNSLEYENMFMKEFNGLKTLHATNAIKIPEPIAWGVCGNQQWLVMEFLECSNPKPGFWKSFGESLAALHKNSNTTFGFHENNFIGSVEQVNTPTVLWPDFYAEHRIMPLIKKSLDEKKINQSDVNAATQLCKKFESIFPVESPCLVHGDLWNGNFMCYEGHVAIFDPAVYYGNREMDLAMSLLFGGFSSEFYENYNEAYPLEKNWKQRVELCQLYPLLVHLLLFGGSYYPEVKEIIRKYL